MRAATRWRRLVTAKLAEMEALAPGRGAVGPDFWNRRARRFARMQNRPAETDPLFARVRDEVTPSDTLLDVGAGPGRFSVALAPHVAEVVAVDSSQVMVGLCAKRARQLGLPNVRTVHGPWQEVEGVTGDVAICSYVLPLIADADRFLARLDAATRRRVFVYLNAVSTDLVFDTLWRHFHGKPRRPGPTYLDAVEILADLGVKASVEVVELPVRARHKNLTAAVKTYLDQLALADEPAVRKELRGILASWLVEDEGELRPPLQSTPSAIVSWYPKH